MRLREVAAAIGCPEPAGDPRIESVVTDSRRADYGSLFAALNGSRVDGHDFAPRAVELGAVALLVERPLELDVPQLVVADVLMALGKLAAMLRARIDPAVVGITGSNGKTTVKEMVAAILRSRGPLLATRGNFNNELGLPLTLFRLTEEHRCAVLEMGASKAGDIAYLCGMARPDIGVVTNIGPAHLKGFGSLEGVARAKGEMFAGLPAEGCAVINADEPWADLWRGMSTAGRMVTFGEGSGCDVRVAGTVEQPMLSTARGDIRLRLALPGRHNVVNAAAAAAVGIALDVDSEVIRDGLASVEPVPGRLNLVRTNAGWTLIDDTYNANPASLYSALQLLAGMQGKAWLVLGDMKELGDESRKMHWEVGEAAKAMGVRRLFTTGDLAAVTSEAFGDGAEHFSSREDLAEALCARLRPGVICLVKGSRSMGMETVVEAVKRAAGMREAS
jgi:UDP-N-acetylmuramoyl-tripeptide--D-alanyl-D-alanine ligase